MAGKSGDRQLKLSSWPPLLDKAVPLQLRTEDAAAPPPVKEKERLELQVRQLKEQNKPTGWVIVEILALKKEREQLIQELTLGRQEVKAQVRDQELGARYSL